MTYYLDHILWICADLDSGCRRIEQLTGVIPRYGGAHVSGATHNSIVGLGGRCYLEILAPTGAAQSGTDELARWASAASEPRVLTYCVRSKWPLSEVAARAKARGWQNTVVAENGRKTPDGTLLRWQWLVPRAAEFGLALPFFIDWLDSIHPSQAQSALSLRSFAVGHPRSDELHGVLAELGSPIDTFQADAIQFRVTLNSPKGVIEL
jgi:hypothetical protein